MSNRACPQCKASGHDKTDNHLYLMTDGETWYCGRCKYIKRNEELGLNGDETVGEIKRYAPYNGEPIRGIKNSIRVLYGDRVGVDVNSGEPEKVYYKKGGGYKVRTLKSKGFYAVGSTKTTELYGMHTTKNATLVIAGGEEDAKAAYQMLSKVMPHNTPCCVSLPDGETNYAAISDNLDWILKHKNILLCLDMDSAGLRGTNNIAALINKPVRVVQMESKDPNDCLLENPTAFVKAVAEAKVHSPGGIVYIADIIEEALVRVEWGVPFPWESLNRETYGMRGGEGYYIGAGVKCGKSEWLNELVRHLCTLGKKSFLIKGEELVKKTARKLGGKLIGKITNRPDVDVNVEELRAAMLELDKGVVLYDRSNSLDWDSVQCAIRHAVIVEGCQFIFIDPVTCFTDGMEARDANTFLQSFSRELDQMAKDLDFTYFCFCHLNNPATGPEHNRGGRVLTSQFTGSRAMSRTTTYMIGIERNKDPELDELEQNTSYFVLLDDRENGNTCRFPVYYDKETGDYLEPVQEF